MFGFTVNLVLVDNSILFHEFQGSQKLCIPYHPNKPVSPKTVLRYVSSGIKGPFIFFYERRGGGAGGIWGGGA